MENFHNDSDISIELSSANVPVAEFDNWVSYVADYIGPSLGFSVEVSAASSDAEKDIVSGASEENEAIIRELLSIAWVSYCDGIPAK